MKESLSYIHYTYEILSFSLKKMCFFGFLLANLNHPTFGSTHNDNVEEESFVTHQPLFSQESIEQAEFLYHLGGYKPIKNRKHAAKILGKEGVILNEIVDLNVPVPPGFILTSKLWTYYKNKKSFPGDLVLQLQKALKRVEEEAKIAFKDSNLPLLLIARISPEFHTTEQPNVILNLGMNDSTAESVKNKFKNALLAYKNYYRFIQSYGHIVGQIEIDEFDKVQSNYMNTHAIKREEDLSEDNLRELVQGFKDKFFEHTQRQVPNNALNQLCEVLSSTFDSWLVPIKNLKSYQEYEVDIPNITWIIQARAFGNIGSNSGSGEAYTRNPLTGEKVFFGHFLEGDDGEEVLRGLRVPYPLTSFQDKYETSGSFENLMPSSYRELIKIGEVLEQHFCDMQHIEFVVQNGVLLILQAKRAQREALSALNVAVDMVLESLISKEKAISDLKPLIISELLNPRLPSNHHLSLLGRGLPASLGAATGRLILSSDACIQQGTQITKKILVLRQTSADDIYGMVMADGILTSMGGMSSHAAVVARGMGKPCIVGCQDLQINTNEHSISLDNVQMHEGDLITIDGSSGNIFGGQIELKNPTVSDQFNTFMKWADQARRLQVRANAETIKDIQVAQTFGAEGIGLCRTEHMFFNPDHLSLMQQMILASTKYDRKQILSKILPLHKQDFLDLFQALKGEPITVRLLDPPLHEFLPKQNKDLQELSNSLLVDLDTLRARISELHEVNPMLGKRGCRLGITMPEIYEMQVQALFEAAAQAEKNGSLVNLEIMVPFVAFTNELKITREMIDKKAKVICLENDCNISYKVGTMIELPQAALQAGQIATYADFMSFGTNDLTQTTLGLSRDDSASFLGFYKDKGIIEKDPFISLDESGVSELMAIACERARKRNPSIKVGVCGEHAGDPASITIFEHLKLDYISCSPFRLPVARLAAAQAFIKQE